MFHPADLTPPRALVAKTPADPLQTMRPYQLLDPALQGFEGEIFMSNVIGIGDVAIKVLKTPRHCLEGSLDNAVYANFAMNRGGCVFFDQGNSGCEQHHSDYETFEK